MMMYLTMQVLSFNKILSKPMDIFKSTTNAALVPWKRKFQLNCLIVIFGFASDSVFVNQIVRRQCCPEFFKQINLIAPDQCKEKGEIQQLEPEEVEVVAQEKAILAKVFQS